MPELPEVETIRNDLNKKITGKSIIKVDIGLARIVKGDPADFRRILIGNKIASVERIGKLMIFRLEKGGRYLLIHLKMTGQLIYCLKDYIVAGGHSLPKLEGDLPNKYSRATFYFNDRSALFFNDMRTFGYTRIVDAAELERVKSRFGIDPLSGGLNLENFKKIVIGRKANIKSLLLNQELIAGIGNIYSDEILYDARIRPDRRGNSLKEAEIMRIVRSAKKILKKAIKYRGTTFNDYVDADGHQGGFARLLKVYGRQGEKCYRCPSQKIIKKKIAGRGTHFCPQCQR
jgi:formamidopyrimidine-DNA glycosylase